MFLSTAIVTAIIMFHFTSSVMSFCHINTASNIQKYMILNSKPTTQILINNNM